MERNHTMAKNTFYFTLFVGIYFVLAFTGVFRNSGSKLIGGLFELLTIPLILSLIMILVFSLYRFLYKGIRPNFYNVTSLLISAGLILAMCFVN